MDSIDNTNIKERIIDILDRLFYDAGIDKEILEYVNLIDDLNMDSIGFVSLIIELETAFGIQIPDEWLLMEKFREFKLICYAVDNLMTQNQMEDNNYSSCDEKAYIDAECVIGNKITKKCEETEAP